MLGSHAVSAVSTAPLGRGITPPGAQRPSVTRTPLALAIGAVLAVPLLTYAAVGAFSRYVADDYCWAGVLRTQGFFNAQVDWYVGYSPRYAFTFIVNVVELAGPAIVPALPAAAIVVWLATLTWTLMQLRLGGVAPFLLAEVAALATLQTAPDLGQSLYWQTGMLTYLLPLIMATFLGGWIVRAVRIGRVSAVGLAVSGLITLFAGGLSETYLIPQNVVLTLALVACVQRGMNNLRNVAVPHLVAALAGGVIALAIIVVAPATTYRMGGGTPADLWLALSAATATAFFQVVRLLRFFPLTVLMCLVGPGVVRMLVPDGWRAPGVTAQTLATVTAIVAIALPFCYFPSFYAQNGNPPARSLIVPGVLLISYLLFIGYAASDLLAAAVPRAVSWLAVALVVGVPLFVAWTTLPDLASTAQYAAAWDGEDQQIRTSRDQGQADVTVPPLPQFLGENFVGPDRSNWFNVCVARYYGVRTIAATEAPR
ncbi:MAG: hypothetical protein JOY61_02830 [Chloroflexi bacterium]|nr:hypothetical protein [Chloroflexota bacterium]